MGFPPAPPASVLRLLPCATTPTRVAASSQTQFVEGSFRLDAARARLEGRESAGCCLTRARKTPAFRSGAAACPHNRISLASTFALPFARNSRSSEGSDPIVIESRAQGRPDELAARPSGWPLPLASSKAFVIVLSAACSAMFSKDAEAAWAFLEGLFQRAPNGIAFYDNGCRYIQVNVALAIRNGWSAAEHVGRHVREVVPGEAEGIERAVEWVVRSNAPFRQTTDAEVTDYYPVRVAGETIGVGAIITAAGVGAMVQSSGVEAGALQGACILAVDDDADTRDLLVEIINGAGGAALVAGSAQEALNVLRARRADVIVCDVGMPERDGYSFLRELRSSGEEAGGWTPAIALTGYARASDSDAALLAGFQMHIPKPVDPSILLDSLVRLWRRRSRSETP
jgi:CheY-like chemotaxis protein